MTAVDALDAIVADFIGPAVVAAGFTGSPNTWRRSTSTGDWAVVTVHRGGTAELARCAIEIGIVPAAWLEFMTEWLGARPAHVSESIGLYREWLGPSAPPEVGDQWWSVRDAGDAAASGTDMLRRLDERGFPVLARMVDREHLLDTLRAGDLGMLKADSFAGVFAFAEAVLLSDEGPSVRLDELLMVAHEEAPPDRKEAAAVYGEWVRDRAEQHR